MTILEQFSRCFIHFAAIISHLSLKIHTLVAVMPSYTKVASLHTINPPAHTPGLVLIYPLIFSFLCFALVNTVQAEDIPIPKSIKTIEGQNPENPKYVKTLYRDLDEDGVPDAQDQCLNSEKGVAVNNYGCELDTDKDGVYDRFDQCPGTPEHIHVNFLGCEGDEDHDRVLDSKDQCHGTPLGTPVDEVGCDNDLDKDGVLNPYDRCPKTPLGLSVNVWGCHPEPLVITHIIFDTGSFDIREDQRTILENDLSRLRVLAPDEVLVITGHTDDVGTDFRNLQLSWNRAQTTKNFFASDFNVSETKIYILGKGETEPTDTNETPEGRQQNRRIELKIVLPSELPPDSKLIMPDEMKDYRRWDFLQWLESKIINVFMFWGQTASHKKWALSILLLAVSLISFAQNAEAPIIVTEQEIVAAQKKYGANTRLVLEDWQNLVNHAHNRPERVKLTMVNDFFNQVRYVTDIEHWQQKDYWATPIELLATNGGDCEDYVIAKYFTLKALGVPQEKLYLNYVKSLRLKQAHMVLTYFKTPKSIPLVLDNLADKILPANKRTDLLPIYSFNGDGLWLSKQRGMGQAVEGGTTQLAQWQTLLKKLDHK